MIIIGSDHSGYQLKDMIIEYLRNKNIEVTDVTFKDASSDDDYPDIAKKICESVLSTRDNLGIAICGTGIGVSIASNKIKKIRAAVCTDTYMAKMARAHNDANILCLGSRLDVASRYDNVKNIVEAFLSTEFEGERHVRRLNKIKQIEDNN